MEFETVVHISEDFATWSDKEKLKLIWEITNDGDWQFTGTETVSYEPDDYP